MTDFDRKSSDNNANNSKDQAGHDPLMELTRLFGARPDKPAEAPSDSDNNSYSGEEPAFLQNVGDEAGAVTPDGSYPQAYGASQAYVGQYAQPQWQQAPQQPPEGGYEPYNDGGQAGYSGTEDQYDVQGGYPVQGVAQGGVEPLQEYPESGYAYSNTENTATYPAPGYADESYPEYAQAAYSDQSDVQQQGYGNEQQYAAAPQQYVEQEPYAEQAYQAQGGAVEQTQWTSPQWDEMQPNTAQEAVAVAPDHGVQEVTQWTDGGEAPSVWHDAPSEEEAFANEYGYAPGEGVYDPNQPYTQDNTGVIGETVQNQQDYNTGYVEPQSREAAQFQPMPPQPAPPVAPAQPVVAPPPAPPIQAPAPQSSAQPGFQGSYFGYGSAVQVKPAAPVAKSPPPQVPTQNAQNSGKAPPTSFFAGRANRQPTPAAAPAPAPVQSAGFPFGRSSSGAPQQVDPSSAAGAGYPVDPNDERLAETLNDFDLTIPNNNRRQRRRTPEVKTVGVGENQVAATESFDLPQVDYNENAGRSPVGNALDQGFSAGYGATPQGNGAAVQDEFLAAPGYVNPASSPYDNIQEQAQASRTLGPEEELAAGQDNGLYNWGGIAPGAAESAAHAKRGGKKWLYASVFVLLFGVVSTGTYYIFGRGGVDNGGQTAVIHADPEAIKVQPDSSTAQNNAGQEQAVYNRVEGNQSSTPSAGQDKLVDSSEKPVDIDAVNEQPPAAAESSLEPDSLDARILQATSHAVPVHMVPTVTVRKEGQNDEIVGKPDANETPTVMVPGATYRSELAKNGANQSASSTQSDNAHVTVPVTDPGVNNNITPPAQQTDVARTNESGSTAQPVDHASPVLGTDNPSDSSAHNSNIDTGGPVTSVEQAGASESSAGFVDDHSITPPSIIPDKPMQQAGLGAGARPQTPITAAGGDTNSSGSEPNDFYVQISSQPSQQAARESAEEAKQRFGSVIGSNSVLIVPADIPGRGVYYRVRISAGDRNAAIRLCERYKQAGGSCFIGR